MRKAEATQTLKHPISTRTSIGTTGRQDEVQFWEQATHNEPRRKIPEMAHFFEALSCSFQMTNNGMTRIMTSVINSVLAKPLYMATSLMVVPPHLASQL